MADAERDGAANPPGGSGPSGFGPIGGETEHLADPGLDMAGARGAEPSGVDRSHNRDTLSSEAMTEMLRDLQDSLTAAEARVEGLEAAHGRVSREARDLALGVAALGDTLSRRVRALETGAPPRVEPHPPAIAAPMAPAPRARPSPRKPEPVMRWTLILAVAIAFVLAGFWLLGGEVADRDAPPPKPIAVVQAAAPRSPLALAVRSAAEPGAADHPSAASPASRARPTRKVAEDAE